MWVLDTERSDVVVENMVSPDGELSGGGDYDRWLEGLDGMLLWIKHGESAMTVCPLPAQARVLSWLNKSILKEGITHNSVTAAKEACDPTCTPMGDGGLKEDGLDEDPGPSAISGAHGLGQGRSAIVRGFKGLAVGDEQLAEEHVQVGGEHLELIGGEEADVLAIKEGKREF